MLVGAPLRANPLSLALLTAAPAVRLPMLDAPGRRVETLALLTAAPAVWLPMPDAPGRRVETLARRQLLLQTIAAAAAIGPCLPAAADSSNRFTTRTTAKRRYYGRVKQGVFEFLAIGAAVERGELGDVSGFFAESLQTRAAGTRTRCEDAMGDGCAVAERRSSRWEDMRTAMELLGNAFRTSGGTAPPPPEKVRQVREARAFAAQVERLRRTAASDDRRGAAVAYAAAVDALALFLNDVDLPPPDDATYRREADTEPASLCQAGYCL